MNYCWMQTKREKTRSEIYFYIWNKKKYTISIIKKKKTTKLKSKFSKTVFNGQSPLQFIFCFFVCKKKCPIIINRFIKRDFIWGTDSLMFIMNNEKEWDNIRWVLNIVTTPQCNRFLFKKKTKKLKTTDKESTHNTMPNIVNETAVNGLYPLSS